MLLRAVAGASAWMADPGNREEAVEMLASKKYVNTSRSAVEAALKGHSRPGDPSTGPWAIRFAGNGLNAPSLEHARFYREEMRRWGHHPSAAGLEAICLEDFHRETLGSFVTN